MNKYIELEDTLFGKMRIVSFNIYNINYIERGNQRRIVIGSNAGGKYYVDASIHNLVKLYIDKLISWEFIDFNYRDKSFDANQYIYTNENVAEYIEKRGVDRSELKRNKK